MLDVRASGRNGPVAQRLEQGTHNPLVPGSNPGGPSLRFGAQRESEGCHAVTKWRRAGFSASVPELQRLRLGRPAMKRFVYVYLLVSEADKSIHQTGVTTDLKERLAMHNRGKCVHTIAHRPWRIETAIAFTCEGKARAFEKYLKSGSGREFARRHF